MRRKKEKKLERKLRHGIFLEISRCTHIPALFLAVFAGLRHVDFFRRLLLLSGERIVAFSACYRKEELWRYRS